MLGVGVEPTCLSAGDFKSPAATNYATRANLASGWRRRGESNPCITVLQTVALPLRHYAITDTIATLSFGFQQLLDALAILFADVGKKGHLGENAHARVLLHIFFELGSQTVREE